MSIVSATAREMLAAAPVEDRCFRIWPEDVTIQVVGTVAEVDGDTLVLKVGGASVLVRTLRVPGETALFSAVEPGQRVCVHGQAFRCPDGVVLVAEAVR
jgi:hypothetical protein